MVFVPAIVILFLYKHYAIKVTCEHLFSNGGHIILRYCRKSWVTNVHSGRKPLTLLFSFLLYCFFYLSECHWLLSHCVIYFAIYILWCVFLTFVKLNPILFYLVHLRARMSSDCIVCLTCEMFNPILFVPIAMVYNLSECHWLCWNFVVL